LFRIPSLKAQNDYIFQTLGGMAPLGRPGYADEIYLNIHTSIMYLKTSPIAILSAEIISQQIYLTEVSNI